MKYSELFKNKLDNGINHYAIPQFILSETLCAGNICDVCDAHIEPLEDLNMITSFGTYGICTMCAKKLVNTIKYYKNEQNMYNSTNKYICNALDKFYDIKGLESLIEKIGNTKNKYHKTLSFPTISDRFLLISLEVAGIIDFDSDNNLFLTEIGKKFLIT